ncbi:MAG: copper amine oxidase N-terminal domain-containing protein [Clostridia bacterium]|nr:copper amine oxidase N-terminal domain-containing protein [Clostridia bacterium]
MRKRKISGSIILCILCIVFAAGYTYAAGRVVESPKVKIVIDGKVGTYTDVPIVVNGSTLLPLRAVLVNLGVVNDNNHIKWNASDKSITILKDSKTISLKVDNNTGYVDGKPIKLQVPPTVYKNKTYIPARFVAESLGKKVVWDGSTQSVLIREQADFNTVKSILEKSKTASADVKRYKTNMNVSVKMASVMGNIEIGMDMASELDIENKLIHMTMNTKVPMTDEKMTTEMYFVKNNLYGKVVGMTGWEKEALPQDAVKLYNSQMDAGIDVEDAMCAGLTVDNSSTGEIVLKGNVFLDELMKQANSESKTDLDLDSTYVEISIDKKTNLINKMKMKVSGAVKEDGQKMNLEETINISCSDYNGNFKIVLPKEIK